MFVDAYEIFHPVYYDSMSIGSNIPLVGRPTIDVLKYLLKILTSFPYGNKNLRQNTFGITISTKKMCEFLRILSKCCLTNLI